MQGFEIVEATEAFQIAHEERVVALDVYVQLLQFIATNMKGFGKSLAFQVANIPDYATHAVTITPRSITNLTETTVQTSWNIRITILSTLTDFNQALLKNLQIANALCPVLSVFAKKYSMSYNVNLEVQAETEVILDVTLSRILSELN